MKIIYILLFVLLNNAFGGFFPLNELNDEKYDLKKCLKSVTLKSSFFNQPPVISINAQPIFTEKMAQQTTQQYIEKYKHSYRYLDLVLDESTSTEQIMTAVKEHFLSFAQQQWELVPLMLELEGALPKSLYKTRGDNGEKYIAKLIADINFEDYLFGLGYYQKNVDVHIKNHKLQAFSNALCEKVCNDFFYLLSNKGTFYLTPESGVAVLPVYDPHCKKHHSVQILSARYEDDEIGRGLNDYYGVLANEGLVIEEAARYMSKLADDYMDLGDIYTIDDVNFEPISFGDYLKKYLRPPLKIMNPHYGELVKLKGLMHVLASGVILADLDVLGASFKNCGVILLTTNQGEKEAICVKVDPGEAFNFIRAKCGRPANISPKDIRYSLQTASEKDVAKGDYSGYIRWDCLLVEQQKEFTESILYALENLIDIDEENNIVRTDCIKGIKHLRLLDLMAAYIDNIYVDGSFNTILSDCDIDSDDDIYNYELFLGDMVVFMAEVFEIYTGRNLHTDHVNCRWNMLKCNNEALLRFFNDSYTSWVIDRVISHYY